MPVRRSALRAWKAIGVTMESSAESNAYQVSIRRRGVEYVIECIEEKFKNQTKKSEKWFSVFFDQDRKWAINILIQGAYIREYHLWERLCKKHFLLHKNNKGSFTEIVIKYLVEKNFQIPSQIILEIEGMRNRVNSMKHDANIEMDRSINFREFELAAIAIESFWEIVWGQEPHASSITRKPG